MGQHRLNALPGSASVQLARAFPHIRVDGIDSDDESIRQARLNAAEHGVAERVDFEVGDISADAPRLPATTWSFSSRSCTT